MADPYEWSTWGIANAHGPLHVLTDEGTAKCGRRSAHPIRLAPWQVEGRRRCAECKKTRRLPVAPGRDVAIVERRSTGASLRLIAAEFGISYERVRQICAPSIPSSDTKGS